MEHQCKALKDAPRAVQNEDHGRLQPSLRVPPAPQNEDDYDQRSNPVQRAKSLGPPTTILQSSLLKVMVMVLS
jgi:hypothetical protein